MLNNKTLRQKLGKKQEKEFTFNSWAYVGKLHSL
jgi:hypothetical protein